MDQPKSHANDLSRRKFIKGAAVIAASGALTGAALSGCSPSGETAQAETSPETQIFSGVCRGNCFSGCFLDVHVRDGQVVRTTARDLPDTQYNRICTKGLTLAHRIYSPARIKYPMKRTGERGSGEFERISWEEAMSTIIDKWKGYVVEFGPTAFGLLSGSGNYGLMGGSSVNGCALERLMSTSGCSYINFNLDQGAQGANALQGGGPTGAYGTLTDSDVIFIWFNPEISLPQNMHFYLDAIEAGVKIVVLDPRYTFLAQIAHKYVPIKPGTDGLLVIAMIKTILANGWENKEFIRDYSNYQFLVKESDGTFLMSNELDPSIPEAEAQGCVLTADGEIVAFGDAEAYVMEGSAETNAGERVSTAGTLMLGRIDAFDINECSEKCGISLAVIEELADLFANGGNVGVASQPGHTHYTNGSSIGTAVSTLQTLTGQIGSAGKGSPSFAPGAAIFDSAGMALVGDPNVPGAPRGLITYLGHGLDISMMNEILDTNQFQGDEVHLKGMYIASSNPVVNGCDHNYMMEWFSKVEFIVVAEVSMNETALYADIVLPVTHWFELEDVFSFYQQHPYALFQEKAIEPLFEARTDYSIIQEIAEGLGYGEYFRLTPEEYMSQALNTDAAKACGISYETLKEQKAILVPRTDYPDTKDYALPASRRKIHSVADVPIRPNSTHRDDIEKYRMVYWEPATESYPGNPAKEKFPYALITQHSRFRTHSQWWDVEPLKEIDGGELRAQINKSVAEATGVFEGDMVRIYNDRGYVVAKAALSNGISPEIIFIDGCWETSEVVDGVLNSLTGRHSDAYVRNSNFYDVIVNFEKVS